MRAAETIRWEFAVRWVGSKVALMFAGLPKRLLAQLAAASIICFFVAYATGSRNAYLSNIFINLGTDFIMVLITVWYVDQILKRHEEESWSSTDFLIKHKIYHLAGSIIQTICDPKGINDQNLPIYQEFLERMRSQDPVGGTPTDYFGDFAKKYVHGVFDNYAGKYLEEEKFANERRKSTKIDAEGCKKIHRLLKRYKEESDQIIDFYGNRLNAEQLKALMSFQLFLQEPILSFDISMAQNEWWQWYQGLDFILIRALDLLEASNLYWKIESGG